MQFLTMSQKDIMSMNYQSIKVDHILISISSSSSSEFIIPAHTFRLGELKLKFDDVSELDSRYIYFNQGLAEDILNFVNSRINTVKLIIVNCEAGLSRSVAIASALSKIINYTDDAIFTRGIPNMLVYTTMLDYFFNNYERKSWGNILNYRNCSMQQYLSPAKISLSYIKNKGVHR